MTGVKTEKKTLIVCATPRSGSSFLSESLRLLGVGDPDEWLLENSLDYARKEAGLSPQAPLSSAIAAISEQKRDALGVFSLKVMWNDFISVIKRFRAESAELRQAETRDLVFKLFPNPKFIYLFREDQLKQAISYVKADQSNIWKNVDDQPPDYDLTRLSFRFGAIHRRLKNIRYMDRKWREFFGRMGMRHLELSYEQVVENPEESFARVASFLEVPEPSEAILTQNPHQRMGDGVNRDWYQRYQRMKALMKSRTVVHRMEEEGLKGEITTSKRGYLTYRDDRWMLPVKLTHRGTRSWPCIVGEDLAGSVVLLAQIFGREDGREVDRRKVFMEKDLERSDSVELLVPIVAPKVYGSFEIRLSVAQLGPDDSISVTSSQVCRCLEVIPTWVEQKWTRYFPQAEETSWGWRFDPVFGYMNTLQFPWLFHSELGWIFCSGTGGEGDDYWFWDWKLGLLWTCRDEFPFLYSFERDTWLEYQRDTLEPRRFLDYRTGEMIEVDRVG